MTANNPFERKSSTLGDPVRDVRDPVLSDTVEEEVVAIGMRVSTAGDVSFVTVRGRTVVLTVTAGEYVPIGVRRVNATGTTATVKLLVN